MVDFISRSPSASAHATPRIDFLPVVVVAVVVATVVVVVARSET